ncbi:hypothetical protein PoB_003399700 [Plakobranchus ocellatus]|uniref:Uncharacterized protein n=1 Tax=Plakobranchus ocellatus TaxID=259542 RepID=A0AAV4AJR6_9GAST|nr:hypothetical protein PoB_003399700 [Plakobranchus ocellatus]
MLDLSPFALPRPDHVEVGTYGPLSLSKRIKIAVAVRNEYQAFKQYLRASPQPGELWFSGPPSGQGADGGARTRDTRVPEDLGRTR